MYLNHGDLERVREMLQGIVWQAEGVFLWAVIAIRSIRDGLQDFADLDEIAQAIQDLPAGVERLYMQMIDRLSPAYRRDAAKFLQIFIHTLENQHCFPFVGLNLGMFYFIDTERASEDLPLMSRTDSTESIAQGCFALKMRLLTHTRGLLDVRLIAEAFITPRNVDPIIMRSYVNVTHRTVKDFLLHNASARSFITAASFSEQHIRLSVARGIFAYLIHLSRDKGGTFSKWDFHSQIYGPLKAAMEQMSMVERLVGTTQSRCMQSLNSFSFIPEDVMFKKLEYAIELPPHVNCCQEQKSSIVSGASSVQLEFFIDIFGMAACSGMVRYVTEVLCLPTIEDQRSLDNSLKRQAPSENETAFIKAVWRTSLLRVRPLTQVTGSGFEGVLDGNLQMRWVLQWKPSQLVVQ